MRLCIECERRPVHGRDRCNPCYKRSERAKGAAWVEADREGSRRWKRVNLGQPGLPKDAQR